LASKLKGNVQKVLAGGRISLPESFKRKWEISDGDIVILKEDASGIKIIPADAVEKPVPQ
jgi:bifunctional DNA-binding transcriptional regulator/antitoxin component of YhaV-PrlF toxin-antitoxin module